MRPHRRQSARPSASPSQRVPYSQPQRLYLHQQPLNPYSYINTQRPSKDEQDETGGNQGDKEDFVTANPAQEGIESQLRFKFKALSAFKDSPRTFAEAAMSARPPPSPVEDYERMIPNLSGPMTLGSSAVIRYTNKKKHGVPSGILKRSEYPFLASLDSVEDLNSDPSLPPLPVYYPPDSRSPPTPLIPRSLVSNGFKRTVSFEEIDSFEEDSQSIQDKINEAMANLQKAFDESESLRIKQDGFDTLEWDSELVSASAPDSSPEPIPLKPQPLTYTTVGSLVDPNAVHQFTAPNRIQRDGSGRRPLMPFQTRPMAPNRQDSPFFHARESPSPLSMQNSMHYSQQIAQGATSYPQVTPALSKQLQLTDQENQVLRRLGNLSTSETRPDNVTSSSNPFSGVVGSNSRVSLSTKNPLHYSSMKNNESSSAKVSLKQLIDGESDLRASGTQSQVQGLEKMQTLQRLAKFENPMQEHARNRLLEFSVSRPSDKITANTTSPNTRETIPRATTALNIGDLHRNYQPPQSSFLPQTTPLYSGFGPPGSQIPTFTNQVAGTPQPLTAGPPGNRNNFSGGLNKPSIQSLWNNTEESAATSQSIQQKNVDQPQWAISSNNTRSQLPPPGGFASIGQPRLLSHSSIVNFVNAAREEADQAIYDTLSIQAASKYYPYGLPADMTGRYTPISYDIASEMAEVSGLPVTEDEKKAKKAKDLDDWFYDGQRRLGKTAEDHICELEQRQVPTNPFGPIGPPKKTLPAVDKKPVSPEEMKNMTTAEAAAPFLDATFGTLLSYADNNEGSRKHLSNFGPSPARYIDSSAEGNKSFFGEDWGVPKGPGGPN